MAPPPKKPSLVTTMRRLQKNAVEAYRIEQQLADVTRATRAINMAEYDKWKESARHALEMFRKTIAKDTTFVVTHEQLFNEAYDLLKDLELDIVFEDDENQFMERLDEHFNVWETMARRTGN